MTGYDDDGDEGEEEEEEEDDDGDDDDDKEEEEVMKLSKFALNVAVAIREERTFIMVYT